MTADPQAVADAVHAVIGEEQGEPATNTHIPVRDPNQFGDVSA